MKHNEKKSAELIARLDAMPFSKWHRSFFVLCFVGILFDAADFAFFGLALPVIAKDFGLGPAQAGLLVTVGLVGAFLGALFWGTISDYIGRRTAFAATVGIFAVFTGLVATAWNVLSLGIFRFLSNFGLGGEVPVTVTLASEYSPRKMRGRMTGNITAAFPLGIILAAVLALVIIPNFGWRWLFAIGVIPAVLLFFVRRHMPESVHFLLSKGRVEEAEKTVADIEKRALGRALTQAEIDALPKPAAAITEKASGVTVFELFSTANRKKTTLLWIVSFAFFWASNGILFMLPLILQAKGIELTQAIKFVLVQSIAAFVGYSASGFLIDRYGRRIILFLYFFVGVFFHLWLAETSGVWLYFAAAAVGFVNPGVYGATGIYVSELHPTDLRATAVGWFFGIGRIGSFIAPTVIGFMIAFGYSYYVLHTFAVAYLIAAVALWFIGIETKGRALEEAAK